MQIKHAFTSAIADEATSAGRVQPSHWNAALTFASGTQGDLPVYDTGATGNVGAITAAAGVLVSSGAGAVPAWSATPSLTSLTLSTPLGVASGGTGLASYAVGDLLYASGASTVGKLADVATGSVLVSGGVGVAPAWSATPTLTALVLGTNSATTGALRFANNAFLVARNAANTADVNIIGLNASNEVMIGQSGAPIATNSSTLSVGKGSAASGSTFEVYAPSGDAYMKITANSGSGASGILFSNLGDPTNTWNFRRSDTTGNLQLVRSTGQYPAGTLTVPWMLTPLGVLSVTGSVEPGTYVAYTEIADPSAPSTNGARLYARDNGAGKTQLVVRFATGAVQVIATEP